MKISSDYFEIKFTGDTKKEALINCTKWIAENIMSQKVEVGEILYRIIKDEKANLPTFILVLYTTIDEEQNRKDFCVRCKDFHKSFFVNSDYSCSSCKHQAYFVQLEQKIKIIKEYRKSKI